MGEWPLTLGLMRFGGSSPCVLPSHHSASEEVEGKAVSGQQGEAGMGASERDSGILESFLMNASMHRT